MKNLNKHTRKSFKNLSGKMSTAGIFVLMLLLSTLTTAAQSESSNSTDSPAGCPTARAPVDFDGDNRTDIAVVRNTGGGENGQMIWYIGSSGSGYALTAVAWGIASDVFIPVDFDGDLKSDIAVWRPGTPAAFYILQSQTNTFRGDLFGQTGDNPAVTDDYTGDGKADPAVYRAGAQSGNPSFWYYLASSGPFAGGVTGLQWGQNGDFPAPGDYDGDGRNDFGVQRNAGGGAAIFHLNQTTAGNVSILWGTPTDVVLPGDYDGDCKTDITVARGQAGLYQWYSRRSTNGTLQAFTFGASATDFFTQGDYDGDGITDVSVWRPSMTPGASAFYWRNSSNGTATGRGWGQNGDYPVANYNRF